MTFQDRLFSFGKKLGREGRGGVGRPRPYFTSLEGKRGGGDTFSNALLCSCDNSSLDDKMEFLILRSTIFLTAKGSVVQVGIFMHSEPKALPPSSSSSPCVPTLLKV